MAVIPRPQHPAPPAARRCWPFARLWASICVSLPGVVIIGAGQPACFVFGYRFRWLGVAGRITIDDVAKHAAVEDSAQPAGAPQAIAAAETSTRIQDPRADRP